MSLRLYPLLILLVVALLEGCAAPSQMVSPELRDARRQAREQLALALDAWTIQGRVALYDAAEAWNADLRWRQHGAEYDIRLSGPFGQGRMRLRGDADGVTLETADGTDYDQDIEALARRYLGRELPVQRLTWWLRGLAAPGPHGDSNLDAQGRLLRLQQDGWRIDFKRYVQVEGVMLPEKIFLENREWRIRLIIQDWRLYLLQIGFPESEARQ